MVSKERTTFEYRQLSGWWLDLSKLVLGGFVALLLKDWPLEQKVILGVFGVWAFLFCTNKGVEFARYITE